jgi:hypothetical protein
MIERDFLEDDDLPFQDDDNLDDVSHEESSPPQEHREKANNDEIFQVRREKEETQRLLEEERHRAFNAERMAIKSALENMEGNRETIRKEIRDLKADLEVARQEGDTDRIRKLTSIIDDKEEMRTRIVKEIDKYSPLLDQNFQPSTPKSPDKPRSKIEMLYEAAKHIPALDHWAQNNRDWIEDPLQHAKFERAEVLMESFRVKGYPLNSAKFYQALDHQLSEEFDSKARRSPPNMRGEINGANNTSIKRNHEDSNIEKMAEKLTDKVIKDMNIPLHMQDSDKLKKQRQRILQRNKQLLKEHNVKSLNDIVWDIR